MIDYEFYRKVNEERLQLLHSKKLTPSECFELIEQSRSDLPYIDQIETTNNCNLRCRMCPRTKSMSREIIKAMPMGLFVKIIDELERIEKEKLKRGISISDFFSNPPPSLVWPGSEFDVLDLRLHHFGAPLLDPLIIERVQYINEHTSFGAQLSETVINLKLKKVELLFKYKLKRLLIALDGTNAKEFETNRGVSINFEREVEKIKAIANLKIEGRHSTVVQLQLIQLDSAKAEKFESMWREVHGISVHYKPFFPYPDIDHSIGSAEDSVFSKTCRIPHVSITVLADGRVVPCNSDYNGEEVFGDLKTQTIREVWNGQEYRNFRKKFIYNQFNKESLCNRCGYYPFYKNQNNLQSQLRVLA
jgi:radical SAM protein with 4Fe4S-binding SPASM domain